MTFDAETLYSFFVRGSDGHWAIVGEVELLQRSDQLVVSPFVLVELEARVRQRFGLEGWLTILDELAGGAWTIAPVDLAAMREHVAGGATLAEASAAALSAS